MRPALQADILIVGAGPAGCAAAIILAPLCRVAVIERHAAPPERIGESLPGAARRMLATMGLLEEFLADGHLPRHALRSAWGRAEPEERDSLRDPDGNGWVLDRARFERRLRAAASSRGASLLAPARLVRLSRVRESWLADVDHDGRPIALRARIVLDAGGRGSRALRRYGAKRVLGDRLICASFRMPRACFPPGVTQVEAEADGWWYASPLPDGAGMFAFHTDADLPAARLVCEAGGFKEKVKALPILSAFAEDFTADDPQIRVCAAQSTWLERVVGEGWLACGDAALAFDPLAAQGLFNALYTGFAAAGTIAGCLGGKAGMIRKYVDEIEDVRFEYRRHLAAWYQLERRWPHAPFWRRRHALSLSDGSSTYPFALHRSVDELSAQARGEDLHS